ncbi:CinA family protein [Inmirania thermothiophila]|uniref:Nicotinamide-nucleotide amidase n=1 Tax=Inmirania thermothiophila TaxID=1750597 RepID=A0A3N1XU92_9GAMM|nr:nicotinamide-nucleotide amidohydrolase family protein [Inmirania thermothiophila]ROR29838.1 nicotinamide-nucleotide amidase [Inmirania thermothiophila]
MTLELAADVGRLLLARGWRLATAESCTGGLVAKMLTDVPGSSGWFDRGLVTYSNEAKQALLGVRGETLARHGAVSEETVREMAAGLLARAPVEVVVAVSGIAGPAGGSPDKPVGTVWLAWAVRGGAVRTQRARFAGDRAAVREQAARTALEGVRALLAGD